MNDFSVVFWALLTVNAVIIIAVYMSAFGGDDDGFE